VYLENCMKWSEGYGSKPMFLWHCDFLHHLVEISKILSTLETEISLV